MLYFYAEQSEASWRRQQEELEHAKVDGNSHNSEMGRNSVGNSDSWIFQDI